MSYTQQHPVVERIKNRRQIRAVELLEQTKLIRKRLRSKNAWNSVKALRDIRYAG